MPRTTIDIDAAVLRKLKQRQRRERKSLGALVSELLAATLARDDEPEPPKLVWTSKAMGALVDLDDKDAVNQVLDGGVSFSLDANVLLYASDRASPFNTRARAVLDEIAREPEIVYLFWPVIMAYLRIATHPGIFRSPLSPAEATGNVEGLLAIPHVQTAGEQERFWARYRSEVIDAAIRGNLVTDAHVVTLMRENGVTTIWTHDRDYRRFRGIEIVDPFG